MRVLTAVPALLAIVLSACLPANSQTNSASVQLDQLPKSGTYYIINASSSEALQPNAPSLGQNVFLLEYKGSGTQQWKLDRKIDPITKKPLNRYTIRLAGEAQDLNLQTHPSVSSRPPILGMEKSVFTFEPGPDGFLFKSVEKNGDAMFAEPYSSAYSEPKFGPNDGSKKFRWNFLSTTADAAASTNVDTLPNTGTYFIVNAMSHEALQPNAPTLGQNVFLSEYNKGGTQKWSVNRKIDPVTNKPTNRYTIKLAGENGDLNFTPHPSAGSSPPILGMDKSTYVFEALPEGVLVKSVDLNGDAMFCVPQSSSNAEPQFGPSDGSKKFQWNFISTD